MDEIDHGPLRYCPADDGVRLAYRAQPGHGADAPALVLVHGLASNSTRFSEFAATTRLRGRWTLLRPDLRGHGGSMHRGSLTRERWCADLVAILDAEGLKRAVFLGHSLGAQVVMELAVAHPGRVQGLILIDPVFPEALGGVMGRVRRFAFLNRIAIVVTRALETLGVGRRQFPYRDLHALDVRTRAALRDNPADDISRLYMKPRADLRFLPLTNYLQDLREVVRPVPDPARIGTPVLVLRSGGATVSDQDRMRDWIARFPHGQQVTIDADHWLLTEHPRAAREAIDDWCESLVRERRE
ncbi:alpha/beta hydrolase [Thioalkalivibrio denitrificans]|uniref:Alpha/beta hydrolase n=1 Tax=Thioalkalivibrio denitrificans TaxID=108003 RepID=A0A1V3NFG3_9GAMM|nr:alpha/beta hydrolase [Thioalkalivibrio denitrificans]OOG23618.1 alpha/beta hydrolase [Thioalkalivibrio denitrificans]